MAKKSRRVKKQVRLSETQMARPGAGTTIEVPPGAPITAPPASQQTTDLGKEYHYVIADLKRIGIIAIAMLALLVILALLLT